MNKASFVSFEKQNIFKWNSDKDAASVRSKKKSYRTKIYEKHYRINDIGKLRLWSIIFCNMILKTESLW